METFKTIRYYLANAGKLFYGVMEILYYSSMLFVAGIVYGANLDLSSWITNMQTRLDVFFLDVIGLLITYLFVVILLPAVVRLLMNSAVRFRFWVIYFLTGQQRKTGVSFFVFRMNQTDKTLIGKAVVSQFAKYDDYTFSMLKKTVMDRKATTYSIQAFTILATYLFIKIWVRPELGFTFTDWVIAPFLVLIPVYYSRCKPIEDALNDSEVFAFVEDQQALKTLSRKLNLNPYCTNVLPEEYKSTILKRSLFLIRKDSSTPVKGYIVVVTKSIAESLVDCQDNVWKTLEATGSKILLVDLRNYLSEGVSEKLKSVKILRDHTKIDFEKEVKEIMN